MAALASAVKFSTILAYSKPGIIYNVVRTAGHWNKDWKPGPYPKTETEKKKAAEKYGLHPDAYQPYPDDGLGYGDYPKLPIVSGDARDPHYPWDYPAMKSNFNEPVHALEELINENRCDLNKRHRFKPWQMWASFFACVGFFGGSFLFFEQPKYYMHPPILAKQYPGQGRHLDFPSLGNSPACPPTHH